MSLEELIQACAKGGDAAAWEDFVQRFDGLITAVVFRTCRQWGVESASVVDDLVQESYLRICADRQRLLGKFESRHPDAFYGYLKVITANVVHDHFRASRAQKRGLGDAAESLDAPAGPVPIAHDGAAEMLQRNILLKEVDAALCSGLSGDDQKRDRAIFWLYYRDGLTAQAIAGLPSVSLTVKGVESVIRRLTQMVREKLSGPGVSLPS